MDSTRDDRMGGLALIAGTAGLLLTMSIHPTGEQLISSGRFAWTSFLGVAAHAIGIASVPVLFLGAMALTRRTAEPGRLSLAALVTYACASVAGMIAATMSGFVAPGVAHRMLEASGPAVDQWRILFEYTGRLNQAFALVLVTGSSVAIILWSLAILRTASLMRGAALYGLTIGPVILLAVMSGQLRLHVFGFGLVVLAQAVWFILVGVSLMGKSVRAAAFSPVAACIGILAVLLIMHLMQVVHAQHGHLHLGPDKVSLAATEVSMPMERFQNRPTVRLKINGAGPYRLIVDSGAGVSVMSPELADELKLETAGMVRVGSPLHQGGTDAKIVRTEHITADGIDIERLLWAANPLPKFTGNETDVPRGVLSPLSFAGYLITIDFPRNRVVFRKGELPSANGRNIFDYEGPFPTVPLTLSGKQVNVTLDLGDRRQMTMPDNFINELSLTALPTSTDPVQMTGGSADAVKATLNDKAILGDFNLDHPEITFVKGLPNGDIGAALLTRFAITLDPGNHRLQIAE